MSRSPVDAFVALSAALTGFREVDLLGTGQARAHFDEVLAIVGEQVMARLLADGGEALAAEDGDAELRARVLEDAELGPVARNVIVLWYLGQWDALPGDWRDRHGASPRDVAGIVSPEGFRRGLVWPAAGTHPMGADGPGFASWATPPAAPGSAP